jgi:tRNA threonylcarbamoyl adenosine modification protein YeaZ
LVRDHAPAGLVLGLDASTPRSVLVLGRRGGELVAWDDTIDPPNQTSSRLLPRLQQLCARAGVEPSAIEAVGCGCGPGTFTGTRVAVATAKGIALGLGCPAIGVSTLGALAFSADLDDFVLPLLDARRGEVYGGLYRCTLDPPQLELRTQARCAGLRELLEEIDEAAKITVIGTAVEAYAELLPKAWRELARPLPGPTPPGLWRAIVAADRADGARDASTLDAIYLRKSYAELGVNRPKRPFRRSPFV